MLAQEGEDLARGFEEEVHNRADEARLLFDIIELLADNLGAFLHSQGNHAQNDADSNKNGLKGPAVLLEDVFDPLE